jgi:hypothetical protein
MIVVTNRTRAWQNRVMKRLERSVKWWIVNSYLIKFLFFNPLIWTTMSRDRILVSLSLSQKILWIMILRVCSTVSRSRLIDMPIVDCTGRDARLNYWWMGEVNWLRRRETRVRVCYKGCGTRVGLVFKAMWRHASHIKTDILRTLDSSRGENLTLEAILMLMNTIRIEIEKSVGWIIFI